MDTQKKVLEIFQRNLPDYTGPLDAETRFADIPDWDSIAQVNAILTLEDAFQVNAVFEQTFEMQTVGEVAEMFDRLLHDGR